MKAASKPLFNILLIAIVFHLSSLLTMSVIGAMFRSLDASTDLLFNELCAKNCLSHRWLRAFVRWDAIHFVSVASRGYLIEKNGAFFPLYPFVLKKISDVAYIFGSVECAVIRFTIGGVLISFVCKLLSIVLLYKISVNFCESKQKIAYISALFFIFNPANAFQCSLYSESLFTALFLCGLLFYLEKTKVSLIVSAVCWSASGAVRSNGLLFCGFYVWNILLILFYGKRYANILINCLAGIFVTLPFVIFQLFLRKKFAVFANVLFPYSQIQKQHWNVGFLTYYTKNNIPNFALAIPTLLISLFGIAIMANEAVNRQSKWQQSTPFIVLWAFLLANCVLVANVQIVTRLLSFYPPFYWTLALLHTSKRRLLPLLSVVYGAVGVPLFACFYPPA